MGLQLSRTEAKILQGIQNHLPETINPYNDLAGRLGIDTKLLLDVLKKWKKQGKIRRMGVFVNHLKIGIPVGAMVLWKTQKNKTLHTAEILAKFREVSHAYERKTSPNWPYNIYTMVHAKDENKLTRTTKRMSEASGVTDYRVLKTEKEIKKTSPRYIEPGKNNSLKYKD